MSMPHIHFPHHPKPCPDPETLRHWDLFIAHLATLIKDGNRL